jgi:SAM-dependent methyltransferase
MAEWFERWFGEEYLALYPHRDEQDAAEAIALIERELKGRRIERALDLACGPGRHARLLNDRWWTVGLDLSAILLRVARENDPHGDYVRADMRILPIRDASLDLVTNLFTSFGYFESDAEHQQVLKEVAQVLRAGGIFVLDFLNATYVRRNIVPRDEQEVGGVVVEQRRSISDDGRFVIKRITSRPDGRSFVERVRLFDREELGQMLRKAKLSVRATYGDYSGAAMSDDAPRSVFFAERE